jgi:hypothetical protein
MGADVEFTYKEKPYGLFFFITIENGKQVKEVVRIGPSGSSRAPRLRRS